MKNDWADFDHDDLESDYYENEVNNIGKDIDSYSYDSYVDSEEVGEEYVLSELKEKDDFKKAEEFMFEQQITSDYQTFLEESETQLQKERKHYSKFIMEKIEESEIKYFNNRGQACLYAKKHSQLEKRVHHIYSFSLKNYPIRVGFYVSILKIKGSLENIFHQNI
jgi:hypothetical protein